MLYDEDEFYEYADKAYEYLLTYVVKEFNKPCLVLRETMFDNQDVFGGSGRNGNFYGLPGLKDFLHEAGVYYAEG